MDLSLLKLLFAAIILLFALLGGLPPLLIADGKQSRQLFQYGASFACGIFLGLGLIHLLPEAERSFAAIYGHSEYPFTAMLCALSFSFLFLIEHILAKSLFKKNLDSSYLPYLVAIILSIHSLIAGATLGIGSEIANILVLFLAIAAHKSSAAFALAVSLRHSEGIGVARMIKVMLLFSMMTPLGIVFGITLNQLLAHPAGTILHAYFNAIAAGTFLYIALLKLKEYPYDAKRSTYYSLLAYILGVLIMAVVAVWV